MRLLGKIQKKVEKSLIYVINFYRNYISHLMLPRCRFIPSCSSYAEEAITKKGLWLGLGLVFKRLLRCHPFSRSFFYDPVE